MQYTIVPGNAKVLDTEWSIGSFLSGGWMINNPSLQHVPATLFALFSKCIWHREVKSLNKWTHPLLLVSSLYIPLIGIPFGHNLYLGSTQLITWASVQTHYIRPPSGWQYSLLLLLVRLQRVPFLPSNPPLSQ